MTVLKKVENGDSLIFLAVTQVVHLSVIIQIVLAAARTTFTMAHRVRVRLGLGLGFVDIRVRVSVRVSVVYAKELTISMLQHAANVVTS